MQLVRDNLDYELFPVERRNVSRGNQEVHAEPGKEILSKTEQLTTDKQIKKARKETITRHKKMVVKTNELKVDKSHLGKTTADSLRRPAEFRAAVNPLSGREPFGVHTEIVNGRACNGVELFYEDGTVKCSSCGRMIATFTRFYRTSVPLRSQSKISAEDNQVFKKYAPERFARIAEAAKAKAVNLPPVTKIKQKPSKHVVCSSKPSDSITIRPGLTTFEMPSQNQGRDCKEQEGVFDCCPED